MSQTTLIDPTHELQEPKELLELPSKKELLELDWDGYLEQLDAGLYKNQSQLGYKEEWELPEKVLVN